MNLIRYIFINYFAILFIAGCRGDQAMQSPEVPNPSPYKAIVYVNGEAIQKDVYLNTYEDTLLSLGMASVTSDALYWKLAFGHFVMDSETYRLLKISFPDPYDIMFADYRALCCVPPVAPGPDVPIHVYSVWEPDSLNNLLHVNVDTMNNEVTGHFSVTFVNDSIPHDTVRMVCDTFYCKWEN